MSMDTHVFGAIRPSPSPGSCDERGKQMRTDPEPKPEPKQEPEPEQESGSGSEPEPESESESETELEPAWDWKSKPIEELVYSDFSSRFDDDPNPYYFRCPSFVYKNRALIEQQKNQKEAVAKYLETSRNISPFDAIPIPPAANVCGNNFPRPMDITDHPLLPLLTDLSKLALEKYNPDNQAKYEFVELVKATRVDIPLGTYYITFTAKPKLEDATHVHASNCPATTFQAHVCKSKPEPVIKCSIKT